jgi:transcription elongation factor Elf1
MNTKEEFAMKHETKICPRCEIEMEAWIEYHDKNVRTWWQCEECGYATEISVHPIEKV